MSDEPPTDSPAAPVRPPRAQPDREAADSAALADLDDPDDLADLDEREAARIRRRDRDAEAEQRELLRPGMGKVFKQILDAQAKAARTSKQRDGD